MAILVLHIETYNDLYLCTELNKISCAFGGTRVQSLQTAPRMKTFTNEGGCAYQG
jgi:hypothetical protein